jgi:hypothetical protein
MGTRKIKGPRRKKADRMELTAERESYLCIGTWFFGTRGKDEFPFDDMDHAKELWFAHRDDLLRWQCKFDWFAQDSWREDKERPWGYWEFELMPKYGPRKQLREKKVNQIGDTFWSGYPEFTDNAFLPEDFETDEEYLKRVKPTDWH